jgi:hypothetical protein
MLEQISYEQFLEWRAFDELDPFGEERMDYRIADVVATLVNIHRPHNRSPYPLSQFLMLFGDAVRPTQQQQSWEQMKAVGQFVFAMIGDGKSQAA